MTSLPAAGAPTLPPPRPDDLGRPAPPPPPEVRGAGRRVLLALGGLVAAALVVQGGLVLVGLWFRTSTRTPIAADTAGVTEVRIEVDAGTVRLEPGERVAGERKDSYGLVKPSVAVRRDGDVLVVSGRCKRAWVAGSWCATDVTMTVPASVRVVVRSAAGDVRLGAVAAPIDVSTGAGDVRLTGTVGPVVVATGAGDIRGERLAGPRVDAESGAGGVRLSFVVVPVEVRAESGAGNVTVEVPGGEAVYRVDADSGAGDRTVDVRTSPTAASSIVVQSGAGNVTVRTVG